MKILVAIVPALTVAAGLAVSGAEAKPAHHKHAQLVWQAPAKVGANLQRICENTKSGRHCFDISKRAKRSKHDWRFRSQRLAGYR